MSEAVWKEVVRSIRTAPSPFLSIDVLNNQRCPSCSESISSVCRYPAFSSNFFSGLLLANCHECGLSWVPYPNLDLDTYYSVHYAKEFRKERISAGKFYRPSNPVFSMEKHPVRDRAAIHADLLNRVVPHIGRILDVGCGEGFLLHQIDANEKYALEPDTNVYSILTDEIGATVISELSHDGYFDVIVASHVLEHFTFENIQSKLDAIYKSLKPGGIFLSEVPDGASQIQVFSQGGRPIHQRLEPHTLFFSSFALHKMLLKSGFQIERSKACEWTRSHKSDAQIIQQVKTENICRGPLITLARKQ